MIPTKPADATWTDEQWQAIYESGTNIIVSAGAGSGKTAVLTERIIEKLKEGISISSLVVLTFTNAAAFEMKKRVREKLIKEIEKGNVSLKEALEKIDQASITTFDSYSLSLVKKYHYILGISKNINIADNVVLERKKHELIDKVFNEFYVKKDKKFLEVLKIFVTKDDNKIKDICLNLDQAIEQVAHKKEFLDQYVSTHYQDEFIKRRIEEYTQIIHRHKEEVVDLLDTLKELATHEVTIEFVNTVYTNLTPFIEAKKYDDYYSFKQGYKSISFTRSKKPDELELEKMKEVYNEIKTIIEKVLALCTYESENALKESILKTKPIVEVIIKIIGAFDEELLAYKKEVGTYEFSDIARLAIHLLETHPDIAKKIKTSISEIMIDEYQDTNDIGDYFISLISNQNVYMVGDIKQSIYRFRNANPSIFAEKYNNYSKNINGKKIDLNKNFRSRREVLDDVNFIFERIMDENLGGADYKHGHAMVFGNKTYELEGKNESNNHFEILNYKYKDNEEAKGYKEEEIEAFIIAQDIKEKVKTNYQVFDKDSKKLRNIKYEDFAILLDRKTTFDLYKKIFTHLEIPMNVYKEESFVSSDEIYVIENILKWVYSLKDFEYATLHLRYAIISVTRSFIYKISDEELFTLFKEHESNLFKTLNNKTCILYPLQEKMRNLAKYSKTHTLSETLEELYKTFDIYHKILELKDIELLSIKLDYLLDIARNLEKMGYQIKDFIEYLNSAKEGNSDVSFKTNNNSSIDAVSIMTIHNSKGLEYPICYYAGLQKEFSKADLKEKFSFSNNLGFICPIFENGLRETFYKELLKNEYNKEDISERLRVFYVALTRAKEKMIIIANLDDKEKTFKKDEFGIIKETDRLKYKSFYDIMLSIKKEIKPYYKDIHLKNIHLSKDYNQIKLTNYQDVLKTSLLKPNYVNLNINAVNVEQKHFSKSYHTLDETEITRINLGIRLHEFLEYMDYNQKEEYIKKLPGSDFEKAKIKAFFDQDFWKSIKNPKIYTELEIIKISDGTILKGIIDLLIEEDDFAYIIDYKLKNIDKSSYEDQILGYKNIIEKKLNKKVKCILYSLFNETYKEIKN